MEWEHISVPVAASVSCAVTRISSPAESSVPVTIRSTSASAAMVLRSCVPTANRDAARLERTTRDFSAESEVVNASGRLNARKSVAGIRAEHAERQNDQASERPSAPRQAAFPREEENGSRAEATSR